MILLALAGAALLTVLLARHDAGQIMRGVAAAGWALAVIVAFHFLPILVDAQTWRVLIPPAHRLPLLSMWWMRWIGESISTLLPSAQVGGDVVRARLAAIRGVPGAMAGSSILGDITLSLLAQILLSLLGVGMLAHLTHRGGFLGPALIGTAIAILAVVGFFVVQRLGVFRFLASMVCRIFQGEAWQSLVSSGEALDCEIRALYGRPVPLVVSFFGTVTSWCLNAVEVWIALWALGFHTSYAVAFVLETVTRGVRSVMFLVPGALGFQEAGYLIVSGWLGIPPDSALALALIRRAREVSIGLPGLLLWQIVEGHHFLRRRATGARAGDPAFASGPSAAEAERGPS